MACQEHLSQEEERVNGILKAIEFKGRKNKGVRQVTMVLHRTLDHQYNPNQSILSCVNMGY
ncbi:MAG: hypothetical protein J6D33_07830 [Turicibacter sp.]|nr:hypothetical protein [Turicibacter sp.]